jgi:hypothetical protein
MVEIRLNQGERVVVKLYGTDGEFKITFGKSLLTVKADLPDNKGRKGVIYQERYAYFPNFPKFPTKKGRICKNSKSKKLSTRIK